MSGVAARIGGVDQSCIIMFNHHQFHQLQTYYGGCCSRERKASFYIDVMKIITCKVANFVEMLFNEMDWSVALKALLCLKSFLT